MLKNRAPFARPPLSCFSFPRTLAAARFGRHGCRSGVRRWERGWGRGTTVVRRASCCACVLSTCVCCTVRVRLCVRGHASGVLPGLTFVGPMQERGPREPLWGLGARGGGRRQSEPRAGRRGPLGPRAHGARDDGRRGWCAREQRGKAFGGPADARGAAAAHVHARADRGSARREVARAAAPGGAARAARAGPVPAPR